MFKVARQRKSCYAGYHQHGRFDIVIDDTSHTPALTRRSFEILFPLLAANGIYYIEDVCTSHWPAFGGRFRRRVRGTTMALIKDRLDGLNHADFKLPRINPSPLDLSIVEIRARHNIVAILKGENVIKSNLNRANPVGIGEWVREDWLPAATSGVEASCCPRGLESCWSSAHRRKGAQACRAED